jgi:hypothetical protein
MILLNEYDKTQLKKGTILILDIDYNEFEKKCIDIFKDGFQNPIITTKVGKTIFKSPKFVFIWDDKPNNLKLQQKMIELSIKNILRINKVKTDCNILIQLSKQAYEYLHNHTRYIKFKFGNISEQREISGKFKLNFENNNTFILDVDELSVQKGEKESAEFIQSFGTFHTHPYDAYKKYNVCIAWPSADDYISFLYMYGLCYSGFHIVSTLEGIYVISLKKNINPEKIIKDFKKIKKNIEYHHGVDYPETDNYCNIEDEKINLKKIKKYVKRINNKGKFNLVFILWKDCMKPFSLKYSNIDQNCLLSTEQADFLKKIKK